ncbi:hypothetical protein AAC387_Pa04g0382 [Persea americana]
MMGSKLDERKYHLWPLLYAFLDFAFIVHQSKGQSFTSKIFEKCPSMAGTGLLYSSQVTNNKWPAVSNQRLGNAGSVGAQDHDPKRSNNEECGGLSANQASPSTTMD